MNLDTTQRHPRHKKESEHFQKKGNSSSIKKEKCYNCNIKEHYANECRKSRKSQQVAKTEKKSKQQKQKLATVLTAWFSKHKHNCLSWTVCYDDTCITYQSDKDDSDWFSKAPRKTQHLQVTEKGKKPQLQVESKERAYMIDWSLSPEVGQEDEYKIMKSFNSEREYEVISFSSDGELSENQKTSPPATVNEFYPEIWSMEKEYPPEL